MLQKNVNTSVPVPLTHTRLKLRQLPTTQWNVVRMGRRTVILQQRNRRKRVAVTITLATKRPESPTRETAQNKKVQEPENDIIANPIREILVCGDKSIARIAAAMRYQFSGRVPIKLRIAKTSTSCAAQRLLQRYCDPTEEKSRLVIFHAGAKDAVSDAQSTEALRVIRDLVIPSSPDLFVCSTTEVAARGKEAAARAF
ncbi:hypothetical protein HPB50_009238 [Hyalomma asiaticum]|uniref:Uncharacterized protein n=1 Tax=Hyalomma asiaticum TaxID=266040 RepID=A0ACB7SPQ4_HYAAI|nr:hypothetical protein HPB50_009238 [Hyalomma asiaticum]